jgi:hypothetical protein
VLQKNQFKHTPVLSILLEFKNQKSKFKIQKSLTPSVHSWLKTPRFQLPASSSKPKVELSILQPFRLYNLPNYRAKKSASILMRFSWV